MILLSILAVFSNTAVRLVSTLQPTSKSSRPFNNPLVTVPKVQILTFMFHSFFNSLARSRYSSLFSHSFSFILRTAKSTILQIPCEIFTPVFADSFSLESVVWMVSIRFPISPLVRSSRILRRVLKIWGDLLSLNR